MLNLLIIRLLINCALISMNFVNCKFENQPKIFCEDGHLIIESATDRNISIRTKGSSKFMIDEINVSDIIQQEKGRLDAQNYDTYNPLSVQLLNLISQLNGAYGIKRRLARAENITRIINQSNNSTSGSISSKITRLRRVISTIKAKMREDNCLQVPCKNGGTCVDLYDDFLCHCTSSWKGKTCEVDIDECINFSGTDLGCQNNAECINTLGSYRCICSNGWMGLHCRMKKIDCTSAPLYELCSHGSCEPASNELGYRCNCNPGWKSNNITPSCTVDVDECTESHTPCDSVCINLPGSFKCGPCPIGYVGNGVLCADKNECDENNGGCSLSPKVKCINTEGSFYCGSCPIGYSGDGKLCTRTASNNCGANNLCHALATCQYISDVIVCICPQGMVGDGFGLTGCTYSHDPCFPNKCKNGGTCNRRGISSYACTCPYGYKGFNCEETTDPCIVSPCLNGGTCIKDFNTTSFRCNCLPEFSGRLCGTNLRNCGGRFTDNTGNIKYPFAGKYEKFKSCAWVIATSPDKVVNLTFTKFDLEYVPSCSRDWLQIHDGHSSHGYLFGRFCGTDLPNGGSIVSFSNQIYMWFRTTTDNIHDGFAFSWKSITPTCGGPLHDSHGTISSPGYPRTAPLNRTCEWNIYGLYNKLIRIVFYHIQFNGGTNSCATDFLAIHDGSSTDGVLLENFCNTTRLPAPLQTHSHKATILFKSGATGDNFFQFYYSLVNGVPGCGGLFTKSIGEFGSPQVDGQYPNNLNCEYLIKLSPGTRIKLHFTAFSLEDEFYDCSYDYVEIFDGKFENDPIVGRWCGSNTPADYMSSSNYLFIKFISDVSTASTGFRVSYELSCNNEYHGRTGMIQSPSYPQNYLPKLKCEYTIEAPIHTVLQLNFKEFKLEGYQISFIKSVFNFSLSCYDDYLEIQEGFQHTIKSYPKFCSTNPPPSNLTLTTNYARLLFLTDEYNEGKGFQIEYSVIDIQCGGVTKEPNKTILYRPEEKGNKQDCEWIIIAPEDGSIFLKFNQFDLRSTQDCSEEYVTIMGENLIEIGIYKKYCGKQLPPQILHPKNMLTIKFYSNRLTGDGFEFSYDFILRSSICGGNFSAPAGSFTSPGWPSRYSSKQDCIWIIAAPLGHQIELNVKSFSLEEDESCLYDYIEIRNGMTNDAPLIGRYCDKNIPSRIPSFTNHLYIKFHSDISLQSEGFEIDYHQTSTGCGGILDSFEGSIQSPHYPDIISDVAQCDWKIVVNKGSTIEIEIKNLDSIVSRNCEQNYLAIYDGSNTFNKKLWLNCSRSFQQSTLYLSTTGNEALIRYISNENNIDNKFYLSYHLNCVQELHDLNGIIESPNFPNQYPKNLNCQWKIFAKKNNKISVEFSHFDVENNCRYDYIEIIDMKKNEEVRHRTYCSKNPERFTSLGEELIVNFITDFSVQRTGFRLEYQIDGCGGLILNENEIVKSPNNPSSVDVYCEWSIRTDFGNTIQLHLNKFNIDVASNDCSENGLIISNSKDHLNPIMKICKGQTRSNIITSSGHEMFIRFYTDSIMSKKEFEAFYTQKRSQCGGKMTAAIGNILSPNFPSSYLPNTNCEWLIEVMDYHTLDLSIIDFDMEDSTNCINDYLEIYDGNKKLPAHLLLHHCGNQLPSIRDIHSTTNAFLIVMKTNNHTEKTGFKLHYKNNCGRIINNATSGNFVKDENDDNCIWTIKAPIYEHIVLIFSHVQANCKGDTTSSKGTYVYDGNSIEAPLITSFCATHPPQIISDGNSLTIHGKSGYFQAFYSLYDNTCGAILISLRGKLASPKYPNSYPVNVECVWDIQFRKGNIVELQFESIDIAKSEKCNEDYLEIRESNSYGKLLGIYCSNELPPKLRAFERMWIKFRSDNDDVAGGFIASYNYAFENEITGSEGFIKSPPIERVHEESSDFSWRIMVSRGYLISLVVKEYYQGLRLFDGFDETAIEIEVIAANTITSNTNTLYILGNHITLKEFLLEWKAIEKPETSKNKTNSVCGDEIIMLKDFVTLKSPGYPFGYSTDLSCQWIIKLNDSSSHASFRPIIVDLEHMEDCSADYLSVYSSKDMINWNLKEKICDYDYFRNYLNMIIHGDPFLKIVFKTDHSINGTGFTARLDTFCGNKMTEPSGIIKGEYANAFYDLHNCTWTIEVRPGRQIQFTFEKPITSVDHHGNCLDFVSIKDGLDQNSPALGIGIYCSILNESIPLTKSHRAFVRFNQTNSGNNLDWILSYKEISDDCYETVKLTRDHTETFITTPNYPNIPNPYTECVWVITAPPTKTINLTFVERFDLLSRYLCKEENIEIRDGATSLSPLKGLYCSKPGEIQSTGNTLRLKYTTNIPDPRNGFKAQISLTKCGGSFYGMSGEVKSFNYPATGAYPSLSVCEYRIIVRNRFRINITLQDIDLPKPNERNNQTDHLVIYDLFSSDSQEEMQHEIVKIFGNNTSKYVQANSNKVLIRFNTYQKTLMHRGFQLSYRMIFGHCGGYQIAEKGTIQSPGFPNGIGSFVICIWKVEVPKGRRIKVKFIDKLLINSKQNRTSTVKIFDDYSMKYLINIIHNNLPTSDIYTSDNVMMIHSHVQVHTSFKLEYSSDEITICQDDLTLSIGRITQLPINYTNYLCEYQTNLNGNETLVFIVTAIVANAPINYAPIQFIVMKWTMYESITQSVSNKIIAMPFLDLKLRLARSTYSQNSTFTIDYKRHNCGGVLKFSSSMNITKPNFNSSYGQIDCVWYVRNSNYPGFFNLNGNFNSTLTCNQEYVVIYNAIHRSRTQLARICKSNSSIILSNMHRDVLIVYHSDESIKSNFEINMNLKVTCGGSLRTGYIQFSKELYKNNIECVWDITTKPETFATLKFMYRFFIEDSVNCTKDYLEVRDYVNNDWKSIGRFCGRQNPETLNSTSNRLQVVLRTDNETTGDGFSIRIIQNCGGILTVTDDVQVIKSPNYPLRYPSGLYCNYTLIKKSPKNIYVEFKAFKLESSPGCLKDNLTIITKTRYEYEIKNTYCRENSIEKLNSKEQITIIFQTKTYMRFQGFMFEYYLDRCGRLIENSTIIESPKNNDGTYYNNLDCVWNITAPEGKYIYIYFKYFDLELEMNCHADRVEIITDETRSFCGNLTNENLDRIIHKNNAIIKFITDNSVTRSGFEAVIDILDECGGIYNLNESNSSFNINYFNQILKNKLDCHYVFNVPDGYIVRVDFHKFNLTYCPNTTADCSCNFIEIRDGISSVRDLKHCGTKISNFYWSSKQTVYIHYVSNIHLPETGINATVRIRKSMCGPSAIQLDKTSTIIEFRLENNLPYPPNTVCFWTISAIRPIQIHFEYIDLEEPTSDGVCNDYLEILNDIPSSISDYYSYDEYSSEDFINDFNKGHSKIMFCGNSTPNDYISSVKKLNLKFITNEDIQRTGFRIRVLDEQICKNYTGLGGHFISNDLKCDTFITAPKNHVINLHLVYDDIMYNNCSTENISIYDNLSSKLLSIICDDSKYEVKHIFSNTSEIRLHTNTYKSYEVTYFASSNGQGCGGRIYAQKGIISSPLYPLTERNYTTCRWDIRTPHNAIVLINFRVFDMGAKTYCKSNYVQLVEISGSGNEEVSRQFCAEDNPAEYKSKSNSLAIVYKKTVHFDGIGWLLEFAAKQGKSI